MRTEHTANIASQLFLGVIPPLFLNPLIWSYVAATEHFISFETLFTFFKHTVVSRYGFCLFGFNVASTMIHLIDKNKDYSSTDEVLVILISLT